MSDLLMRTSNISYLSRVQYAFNLWTGSVVEYFHRRLKRKEARAAFMNICRLDDKMLDDIGVKREEVDWALNLPLEINASDAMFLKARNRRMRGK